MKQYNKSSKLHNWVMKLSGITLKQQIRKFSQDTLPYFTIFPNLSELMVHCCYFQKNATVMKNSIAVF